MTSTPAADPDQEAYERACAQAAAGDVAAARAAFLALRARRATPSANLELQLGAAHLRLGEIDAAIEKGALGKFTGHRESRAVFQYGIQHHLGREQSPVTRDFHYVFAGKRSRRTQNREQHFVHDFALPNNFAVVNGMRLRLGRFL